MKSSRFEELRELSLPSEVTIDRDESNIWRTGRPKANPTDFLYQPDKGKRIRETKGGCRTGKKTNKRETSAQGRNGAEST